MASGPYRVNGRPRLIWIHVWLLSACGWSSIRIRIILLFTLTKIQYSDPELVMFTGDNPLDAHVNSEIWLYFTMQKNFRFHGCFTTQFLIKGYAPIKCGISLFVWYKRQFWKFRILCPKNIGHFSFMIQITLFI